MHVLGMDQFEPAELEAIFNRTDDIKQALTSSKSRRELAQKHTGKQICSLFYEPSTRTRTSFEAAALKLGMGVVSTENASEFSSAAKGETIEDTVRVLEQYGFSAIVIRHPETGAVARAAAVTKVPIINAGDGKGEHPTQSLLDTYTIKRHFNRLNNLKIVMGGDLRNGRTVRSLARILAKYPGNRIIFISTPELSMADDILKILSQSGTSFSKADNLNDALADADVVYWTRLQKERLSNPDKIDTTSFTLTKQAIKNLPKKSIIMHPLPRVDEIATDVDSDRRAIYFEQAGNGLYVRMALLDQIASQQK